MQSESEIPEWRQYEWLITKIFHDRESSFDTKVLHDSSIKGQYSERSRQVDILVKSQNLRTIIECKHYSSPIDLKSVESFLGMFADVKADDGIMVSSSGYTKSAEKRISEFQGSIVLEHLNWESAYENSFGIISYGRISDICSHCLPEYRLGKEVPGLLCWQHGFAIELKGKLSSFSISKCLKCGIHSIYCDTCGWITVAEKDESCCELRNHFITFYNET